MRRRAKNIVPGKSVKTSVFDLQNVADFHIFVRFLLIANQIMVPFFNFVRNTLSLEKGTFLFVFKEITWVI